MPALSRTSGDISSYPPARWERETPSGCHVSLGLVMQEWGYVEAERVCTGVQALRGKIRLPPAQSCSPQWGPRVKGRGGIGHVLLLLTPSLFLHPLPGPHGGRTAPALGGPEEAAAQTPTMPAPPALRNLNSDGIQGFWGLHNRGSGVSQPQVQMPPQSLTPCS